MIRYDRSAYDRIVSIESLNIENLNIDCENIEIPSLKDLSPKDLFRFRFSKHVSVCPSKKWHFLQDVNFDGTDSNFENVPYR